MFTAVSHSTDVEHSGLVVNQCIRGDKPDRICYIIDGVANANRTLLINDSSIGTMKTALIKRMFMCEIEGTLVEPPTPSRSTIESLLKPFRNKFLRMFGCRPSRISPEQFVEMYTGRKRSIYEGAKDVYLSRGVERKDAYSCMFVKMEKVNPDKAPRCIQPRGIVYNLALGLYLKHIEHHCYSVIQRVFGDPDPVVMKGFNADQVGQIIANKWHSFKSPIAIGLDATKFDMHVSAAMLGWEHELYLNLYNHDPELRKLLSWQMHNKGFGYAYDGKLKYQVEGKRFSGDMNTALGNCIIMCAMIYTYAKERGIALSLINNGDDCVVIMEKEEQLKFCNGLDEWFLQLGFRMTTEAPVNIIEQIEFCQAHPVLVNGNYRMVRNFNTAREKDSMCLLPHRSLELMKMWVHAVGECGLALCSGIPVMQSMYSRFMDWGVKSNICNSLQLQSGARFLSVGMESKWTPVRSDTRVSFWLAFGITPDEQVALEQYYTYLQAPSAMEPCDNLTEVVPSPF